MKVAIIGMAPFPLGTAPFLDPEWQIWSLNEAYLFLPDFWDRWFQMHRPEIFNDSERDPQHALWLCDQDRPIYMLEHYEDIPASVAYPLDEVIKTLGSSYFTSTLAYMIAMAAYEGFEEIALFGVDMDLPEEYAHQKACCEFWIGLARGRGIKVTVQERSPLLKADLYGYESG